VSDVTGVICRRNFHGVKTDGGLFEDPGGQRQVNGLEGAALKGLLRVCSNSRRVCLLEGMERWLGRGRKIELGAL